MIIPPPFLGCFSYFILVAGAVANTKFKQQACRKSEDWYAVSVEALKISIFGLGWS